MTLLQHLTYEPQGLMAENDNVYETVSKEISAVFLRYKMLKT